MKENTPPHLTLKTQGFHHCPKKTILQANISISMQSTVPLIFKFLSKKNWHPWNSKNISEWNPNRQPFFPSIQLREQTPNKKKFQENTKLINWISSGFSSEPFHPSILRKGCKNILLLGNLHLNVSISSSSNRIKEKVFMN